MLKNAVIIVLLALVLGSCSGSRALVSFEILEPALISYPEDVELIAYLNHSPRSLNSFRNIDMRNLNDTDLYIIDTMICASFQRGFKEGKKNSMMPYINNMVYLDARRQDTAGRAELISPERVERICEQFGLDALISLDYYDFSFYEYVYLNLANSDKQTGAKYEKVYTLIPEVSWSVMLPGKSDPLARYTFKDSLWYDHHSRWPKDRYYAPLDMLRDGATDIGYSFGKQNVPVWNSVDRVVFTGRNQTLRVASRYTNKGEWKKAARIWSANLHIDNKKLAARSAHNLAVYYELEDNIEEALEYSKMANNLWASPRIEFYKEELELRRLNKEDISKQLRIKKIEEDE